MEKQFTWEVAREILRKNRLKIATQQYKGKRGKLKTLTEQETIQGVKLFRQAETFE